MRVLGAAGPLRLLMQDNDTPRLWPARLCARPGELGPVVDGLRDGRILVDAEEPLVQMFTTITLQLNIAVLLEEPVARGLGSLESKTNTGATDINKFYGKSAPNFLRRPA